MSNLVLLIGLLFQDGGFVVTDRASGFVVTDRAEIPPPTGLEDAAWEPAPTHYVYFMTADWCSYCQQYKNDGRLKKIQDAVPTKVIDVEVETKWKSLLTGYPSFLIVKSDGETEVKRFRGITSPETVISAYRSSLQQVVKPVETKRQARNPRLFGNRGTSHESRETLIRHLYQDGIHRGRHTLQELQAMSDDALNDIHQKEHTDHGDVVRNGLWSTKK